MTSRQVVSRSLGCYNFTMKVSELGEFGLIDLLAKMVNGSRDNKTTSWQRLLIGIGDDAAAWESDALTKLASTDSLIQGIHFTLDIASWEEIGWRAMATNLSDIAAMGGLSQYALVSLALPDSTRVEDITALYQGMIDITREHGVAIAGGDTNSAPLLVINITILGSVRNQDKHILSRSTAKVGEQIAVTGYLGAAAAGLEMLTKRLKFGSETTTLLKKAFLQPYPLIAEGQLLVEQGVRTAIDISDGLLSDLGHICKTSQVSALIEIDRVPIHSTVKANFGEKSLELALSGGEDYQLLFTASTETINKVKKVASCPITVIGEIVSERIGEITLVDSQGNTYHLNKTGWEHFKTG